jgi:4-diphosphocytidyl-2-C-methyl-D-erythritol kinase
MVYFPHCKINLGLHVIEKRNDGYHNIETCFYPVPWTDVLEVIPATEFSFTSSGNQIPGALTDNLCARAYQLLQENHAIKPVSIHLHKTIPTGAGLGGGSADAAFALRMINDVLQLKLSDEKLKLYALMLGSDCPFFIQDQPKLGTGRGDILRDIAVSLRGKYLALIKPDIHVSTAEAYAGVLQHTPEISITDVLENHPLHEWKNLLKNDFEKSVFNKFPAIKTIKEKLYAAGAVYASMSGSGSSVYGIFDFQPGLSQQFPEMTCWSGML